MRWDIYNCTQEFCPSCTARSNDRNSYAWGFAYPGASGIVVQQSLTSSYEAPLRIYYYQNFPALTLEAASISI